MSSKLKVTVVGAGGKMGTRITDNLAGHDDIELFFVENSPAGVESIRQRGFETSDTARVLPVSDITVLAVPDSLIKKISAEVTPELKPGSALLILDPAAAVAKELCMRDDCTFVVAHPCHPSYFLDQDTYEARHDYFGGAGGKQDIVVALIQGDDRVFSAARKVAELMFEPVVNSYVLGVRDIAFLEPTLVELLGATCLNAMAETVREAVRRGIPREAAVSFLSGHIYNLSANFLGFLGNTAVSDACRAAMDIGDRLVLRDSWRNIWDDEVLERVIGTMLHPENPQI